MAGSQAGQRELGPWWAAELTPPTTINCCWVWGEHTRQRGRGRKALDSPPNTHPADATIPCQYLFLPRRGIKSEDRGARGACFLEIHSREKVDTGPGNKQANAGHTHIEDIYTTHRPLDIEELLCQCLVS